MGMGRQMPPIGRIYGKVMDKEAKSALEYASVLLTRPGKDSVMAGGLTRANGEFSLDKLYPGPYTLTIRLMGFADYKTDIKIDPQSPEMDLGNILVSPHSITTDQVEIQAQQDMATYTIDRKVFNVDRMLNTAGGTAVDILRNVPSVTVDVDGNASLRGNSPQIYIDGRPTTLTLQQIPAEQIERVEVITNPSAKFEASATGGILNIVMKQNRKPGYFGMVTGGVGTNNRYNGMVNGSLREGRFGLLVMYNINHGENIGKGWTNRTFLANGLPSAYYEQNNQSHNYMDMQMGRVQLDYSLNNRNTLSAAYSINDFNRGGTDSLYNQNFGIEHQLLESWVRLNTTDNHRLNHTGQLTWRKTFPQQGHELTADATFNTGGGTNLSTFTDYPGLTNQWVQDNDGGGENKNLTLQLDYVRPLAKQAKLELGLRYNEARSSSYFHASTTDSTGTLVYNPYLSNDFSIVDQVAAAYGNYSIKKGTWAYQAGLRFEYSNYQGTNDVNDSTFGYRYPGSLNTLANSLFPSLFITHELANKQQIQFNISRKIGRPNFFQMMPFIMFGDRYNYRIGNPTLKPEFINLAEISYTKTWEKGSALVTLFGRADEQPIVGYAYPNEGDSSILINTFANGKTAYRGGIDLTAKYTFLKSIDVTGSFNGYYVNVSSADNSLTNSGFAWEAKGNLTYRMPKEFSLQVTGNYEAPKVLPQGTTLPQYGMDASLRKDFGKMASLTLNVNDVFNTRRFGQQLVTSSLEQELSRRRETRFVMLSFTMRFGKPDASLFRKAKANGNRQQSGGGMEEY